MKILTQKIDTSNITNYCGVIYYDEPLIFVREHGGESFRAIRVKVNTVSSLEDVDPSAISEEVFFDNSIDLYEWAVNRLQPKGLW